MGLQTLDIILLAPIAIGFIRGLVRGFVRELAALLGLLAGIVIALLFAPSAVHFFEAYFPDDLETVRILSYLGVFVIVVLITNLLASIVNRLLKALALGPINTLLGGTFGGAKWALIMGVFCTLLNYVQSTEVILQNETLEGSVVFKALLDLMNSVLKQFNLA